MRLRVWMRGEWMCDVIWRLRVVAAVLAFLNLGFVFCFAVCFISARCEKTRRITHRTRILKRCFQKCVRASLSWIQVVIFNAGSPAMSYIVCCLFWFRGCRAVLGSGFITSSTLTLFACARTCTQPLARFVVRDAGVPSRRPAVSSDRAEHLHQRTAFNQ